MSSSLPEVTDELLAALEWYYALEPLCRVCGAKLTVASSQGMKMTCDSDAASPLKYKHEAAGATWQEALRHSEASTRYDPPAGDARVLALAAEVRQLRAQREAG